VLRDTSDFNATSLVHQPCSQAVDDEPEHRINHHEPERSTCDRWAVRFASCLCLHIVFSAEPELIKNTQDRERQPAQHKDNSLDAVVPDDGCVIHDFRIATKQLVAPPVDENAGAQGKKRCNGESDAQRRLASGLDAEKKSEHIMSRLRGGEKLGFEPAEVFRG
jgi:hypothetical protein